MVVPPGSLDNPGGSTPTGGANDNTITEQAPDSKPPPVAVTQDIPGPTSPEGGGGGGVVVPASTSVNENPQVPTVAQTGVPQSDPSLSNIPAVLAADPTPAPAPAPGPEPAPD